MKAEPSDLKQLAGILESLRQELGRLGERVAALEAAAAPASPGGAAAPGGTKRAAAAAGGRSRSGSRRPQQRILRATLTDSTKSLFW